jgi:N-acetylneuraminic acid mutarotase
VTGGEDPSDTHGDLYAYDPTTDAWSTGPSMPTPRHGLSVLAAGGNLHVIGGGVAPGGGSDSSIHEVLTP